MRDQFVANSVDTPVLDAKLLAQHAFGLDATQLATDEHGPAPADGIARLEELASRRLQGEPVARIFGRKEFYGLSFGLNEDTLVPRPDTELLVDLGLGFLKGRNNPLVADLGTGSGCIGLALLHEHGDTNVVGVDLSACALEQAEANARQLGLSARFTVRAGSWFSPLVPEGQFDLIVSNPPYIETATIKDLSADVRLYDPNLALDGGDDGLAPYRVIAGDAHSFLKADGAVMVEVGAGQAPDVVALFQSNGFGRASVHKDLAGIERVVVASYQPIV